jgi:microcystin-dependent protein
MEGTMAVVTTWAADFAPKNWAYCNGQTLAIAQNTALFSLLGTTYGGNGQTTFCLPNLQSRTVLGTGTSSYSLGQVGGAPQVTLTLGNIPPHNHNGAVTLSMRGNSTDGTTGEPNGNFPGNLASGYSTLPGDTNMLAPGYSAIVGMAGGSQPYNTEAPYLVVNYIICMYGIYPSRN